MQDIINLILSLISTDLDFIYILHLFFLFSFSLFSFILRSKLFCLQFSSSSGVLLFLLFFFESLLLRISSSSNPFFFEYYMFFLFFDLLFFVCNFRILLLRISHVFLFLLSLSLSFSLSHYRSGLLQEYMRNVKVKLQPINKILPSYTIVKVQLCKTVELG